MSTTNKEKEEENEKQIGVGPISNQITKKMSSQLEENICKIHIIKEKGEKDFGTGFFCKIPFPDEFKLLPVLITCNHVLDKESIKPNKIINISLDDDRWTTKIKIDEKRKIFSDEELDVTIIEIKPNKDKISNFLEIDENIFSDKYKNIYKKKEIYLLQYAYGKISSHSEGIVNNINGINIEHTASTDFGSSGSPILNLFNMKVIGVHKKRTRFEYNEGTFIKFAIERFNKKYLNYLDDNNNDNSIYYSTLNDFHKKCQIKNNINNINIIESNLDNKSNNTTSEKDPNIQNTFQKNKIKYTKKIKTLKEVKEEQNEIIKVKNNKTNENCSIPSDKINIKKEELPKKFLANNNINTKEKEKLKITNQGNIKSIRKEEEIENILSSLLSSNKNQIENENQYLEFCMDKHKLQIINKSNWKCNFCHFSYSLSFCFYCNLCNFYLCKDCLKKYNIIIFDEIKEVHIGFAKIGPPIQGFTDIALFIPRIFLPSNPLTHKNFLMASIYLKTEHNYEIVVEYGEFQNEDMKDINNKSYPTYYWTSEKNGLRFAEMDYNSYKKYKLDYDSYSKRIFKLYPGKKINLYEALKICNEKNWNSDSYNSFLNNSKDFVAEFIKATKCVRKEGEEYRGYHNYSSSVIPKVILDAIEENEDEGWDIVGKIPVIGPFIEIFHAIGDKITD